MQTCKAFSSDNRIEELPARWGLCLMGTQHCPHQVALRAPGYVDVQRGQRRPQRPTWMLCAECIPSYAGFRVRIRSKAKAEIAQ